MPNGPDAEHDLVLGLIGLRHGLYGHQALLDALATWTARRGQDVPLGQVFEELGILDAERRSRLEGLTLEAALQLLAAPNESIPSRTDASTQPIVEAGRTMPPETSASDYGTRVESVATQHGVESTVAGTGEPFATRVDSTVRGWQDGLHPPAPPPMLERPRYHVVRPHAKGGLGEVHVAFDNELQREVALKNLRPRHADRIESRNRFLREAKITGQLEHPGIVPVYGLGQQHDGRPYYAMRFIRGNSLQDAIDEFHREANAQHDRLMDRRLLELYKLVRRFLDVCNAVEYAHSRNVLHRDIKPANVMLGPYGETLVVDWGLAKPFTRSGGSVSIDEADDEHSGEILDESGVQTVVGRAVGTPQYMSPEAAAGELHRLGPASDVYSLGATLYCLLTGQAPMPGDLPMTTILERVQAGDFASPRSVAPHTPPALEAVCLKAMAVRPEDRYPTVRALAEDLEHWLAGEPVSAYPEWIGKRAWRWGNRHPWVVGSVGIITGLVIIVFLIAAFVVMLPAFLLALIGAAVGTAAGALGGGMKHGARRGWSFAFRIGTAVGGVVMVLSALAIASYEFSIWRASRDRSPTAEVARTVTAADGLAIARDHLARGDIAGATRWRDWVILSIDESLKAPLDGDRRAELIRARDDAVRLNSGASGPGPP